MDNLVLSPIPVADLLKQFRDIVREEISAEKQKQDERLISPAETVLLFQPTISKLTLKHWSDQGLLNMVRIGGRTYYRKSEVLQAGQHLKKYKKR